MSKLLVTDELWAVVEPLLPKHEPSPAGGHPRVDDRVCLTGIVFVLKTGIPWEDFPHEMGCCGMTLWNRLDEWRTAGVWPAVHEVLLARMRAADLIDFSRAVADSSSVRAVHGGKKRDRAPWTAANAGASTTCSSEAGGTPLVAKLTGANRHDSTQLIALVDDVPPVRGKAGRPLRRPPGCCWPTARTTSTTSAGGRCGGGTSRR